MKNLPFFLLTIFIFSLLLVLPLVKQGMFFDGVIYSSVAYNMAHGIGSLWQPSFTSTFRTEFFEHPPLGMYIQSWFIYILGDSIYVDKIYGFFTAIMGLTGLALIWRNSEKNVELNFIWLPILLWLLIPLNIWAYKNNFLETTLVIFSTFASWAILKANSSSNRIIWLCSASLLIAGGFFTKGLQAFFPFAIPIIYAFVFRTGYRNAFKQTFILLCLTAAMIGIVLLYKPAYHNIYEYFNQQLILTFSGARGGEYTGWKHLYGFLIILKALLPLIVISLVIFFIQAKQTGQSFLLLLFEACRKKEVAFYCLIALSASLPILISSRQASHYFLPAFPFFIIMFSAILSPICYQWISVINVGSSRYKVFLISSIILVCLAGLIVIASAGKIGRDKAYLEDMAAISKVVPDKSIISIDKNMADDWTAYAYFYRYHQIAFTNQLGMKYYLQQKNGLDHPAGYISVDLPLQKFALFEKAS